jgi:tetratricopeptide (TPR) repeat protein
MMFMVPAMGVPSEELLQDTLKSILVSLFTLSAAFVFFAVPKPERNSIQLHAGMLLPVALMVYALVSMVWSHRYLAGVEAVRWFVIALIIFLVANTATLPRTARIAWGIQWGALTASLWTALQYWFDLGLFPQGAPPASTFINRNFFAEFLVCALPFSMLLAQQATSKWRTGLLASSLGIQVSALMMAGTRSALVGLIVLMALVCVFSATKIYQTKVWPFRTRLFLITFLTLAIVMVMGLIPGKNPQINLETGGTTSIQRALFRTSTVVQPTEYTQGSMSIRASLWRTTGGMIAHHWLAGVGAGAWEVYEPLFQSPDKYLETDYYAHNDILQLVSEYGVVGWLFLSGLVSYLLLAVKLTWRQRLGRHPNEIPPRMAALTSLGMLFLVSNAGFPMRLATTCAMFAVCIGLLMASDFRIHLERPSGFLRTITWRKAQSTLALIGTSGCICIALYIAGLAIVCESKFTRALKAALTISQSSQPGDPRWDSVKTKILEWTREGIAINPHYRKLTPSVADALASWGDWANAQFIWESTIQSRPYVSGILMNLARSQIDAGNFEQARQYLKRSQALQPLSVPNSSLQVLLLARTNQSSNARILVRNLLQSGRFNEEITVLGYALGKQSNDGELIVLSLESRIAKWPDQSVDARLKLGDHYNSLGPAYSAQAIGKYREAIAKGGATHRDALLTIIPEPYRTALK